LGTKMLLSKHCQLSKSSYSLGMQKRHLVNMP